MTSAQVQVLEPESIIEVTKVEDLNRLKYKITIKSDLSDELDLHIFFYFLNPNMGSV